MIVDAHCHYNTTEDFKQHAERLFKDEMTKRVVPGMTRAWQAFEAATSVDAWIESMDRYGVDKILLQTAPFGNSDAVAEFAAKAPDRFVGLANIDFMDPEGSSSVHELDRCVNDLGLKGIGELYPKIGPWDPADEKCFPIYEKAQELDIPIMFHGGYETPSFGDERFCDPRMLDPALRHFPDLKFIVCHMALNFVGELYLLMQSRPNLYVETNKIRTPMDYFLDTDPVRVLQKYLEKGFADRILWSTDVQAPYNSDFSKDKVKGTIKDNSFLLALEHLKVGEEDIANILGGNAERLFKL